MSMHPATKHLLQFFRYSHLPEYLKSASEPFHTLAHHMAHLLPANQETTACLRKLLEAKDCAVRAVIADGGYVEDPL